LYGYQTYIREGLVIVWVPDLYKRRSCNCMGTNLVCCCN